MKMLSEDPSSFQTWNAP